MRKKKALPVIISIVFVVLILCCALFFFLSSKKAQSSSPKTSATTFATAFLTNYYTGQYTVNISDDAKTKSSQKADITFVSPSTTETSTEQGIDTSGKLVVSKRVSQLFTKKGLNEMLQNRNFDMVKDNTKTSLVKLSLKQTDKKGSRIDYDYSADVNMQGKATTIHGQLTLVLVHNTYKIDRTWF